MEVQCDSDERTEKFLAEGAVEKGTKEKNKKFVKIKNHGLEKLTC